MSHNANHWLTKFKMDDIDNGLVADFNGSLSGLGIEPISDTYDMSEALLALPAVFKDEEDSLMKMTFLHQSSGPSCMAPFLSLSDVHLLDSESNASIFISSSPVDTLVSSPITPIILNERSVLDQSNSEWLKLIKSMKLTEISDDSNSVVISNDRTAHPALKFQYVLNASTSPTTKLSEDTLTYLNQGQSYELACRCLADGFDFSNAFLLKSVVSVRLEDRRMQQLETQQVRQWQMRRPNERFINIDPKLSRGFIELKNVEDEINCVEVLWNCAKPKQLSLMLKVNCISTEFTARKSGGEKGMPFRLQVETYLLEHPSDKHSAEKLSINSCAPGKLISKASCQIKVFKMRGADRKNKTDREKLGKLPHKISYQPYFECTVLTEMPIEFAESFENQFHQPIKDSTEDSTSGLNEDSNRSSQFSDSIANTTDLTTFSLPDERNLFRQSSANVNNSQSSSRKRHSESCLCIASPAKNISSSQDDLLMMMATPDDVNTWLGRNRFNKYIDMFQNFSGADLLRLTKEDLIQICGLTDGIRLYNTLLARFVQPRLTIFVCQEKTVMNTANSPVTSSLSSSPSPSPTPISDSLLPSLFLITPTPLRQDAASQIEESIEENKIVEVNASDGAEVQAKSEIEKTTEELTLGVTPERPQPDIVANDAYSSDKLIPHLALRSCNSNGVSEAVVDAENEVDETDCVRYSEKPGKLIANGLKEVPSNQLLSVSIEPIANSSTIPDLLAGDAGLFETAKKRECAEIDTRTTTQRNQTLNTRPKLIGSGAYVPRYPARKSSCGSTCKRPIRDARAEDGTHEMPVATSKKQKIHHLQPSPSLLDVYHAIYMDHLTERQLAKKLADLYHLDLSQITEILLHSQLGIHILVTDLVVQNIPTQSHYLIEVDEIEDQPGMYRIILKSVLRSCTY